MIENIQNKPIVIWGAGGHACVVRDLLKLDGRFEIAGHLQDNHHGDCPEPAGTVLGGVEQLPELKRRGVGHAVIAIGHCATRLEKAYLLIEHGFELVSFRHPHAVIAEGVSVGCGTVVMAGVVVNAGAKIGKHVILNTGCSVDHDCEIEDGAHVCPGVHLAGGVKVETGAWVGIGSTVIERVRIGAGSFVGAGSLVLHDVPAGVLAYGRPARVVRSLV